ncbi:SNF7 family protein [Ostertagia ostertagi]
MDERSRRYLPPIWHDDLAMQGYMSVIKARAINPIDHDRKIKFWTDLISTSCEAEGNAIISVDSLKKRFRRGDQVPSSLNVVVEHLSKYGVLMPLSKWQEQHSSWVGWGFSQLTKTSGWLFGNAKSTTGERFIHLPTIKVFVTYQFLIPIESDTQVQADNLMKLYSNEFQSEIDGTGSIIAYSTFYDRAADIVFERKENFDIVLAHLSDRGDVTVGQGRNGEQILKFRDTTSEEPVRFTEADASVHDIRKAMSKIEKEISVLERKVEKLDGDCRAALRNHDKTRAANLLRQKKRLQKDISDKDVQYQRLLTMLQQLSATKVNFQAIGQAIVPKQHDDEDLEKELNELIAKQKPVPALPRVSSDKLVPSLPEVPSNTVGYRELDEDDAMSLEKRLERLRSAM